MDGRQKGLELCKLWHQSEEGKLWHKKRAKAYWKRLKKKEHTCITCGRRFKIKTIRKVVKYCSSDCLQKKRREIGKDNESRKCVGCGKTFLINKYYIGLKCKLCF